MNSYDAMLHIYGQAVWHDAARLVGTRTGLEALQEAIRQVLRDGAGTTESMTADGEGYDITVRCVTVEAVEQEPLPYTDPMAR